MTAKFGQIVTSTNMDAMAQAAADASLQTAIDNIVADINDLKAKLRTAGILGT